MSVTVIYDLPMKTRDGVTLYSTVYLPDRFGKYPLIVLRSPYDPEKPCFSSYCADFCKQGIGVLCQSVRGTGPSEGEFDPCRQECYDGEDFLEWVKTLDFCNGNIVTNGESYPGHTQWQLARHGRDVLKGITPHNAPLNLFPLAIRRGGAFCASMGYSWALTLRKNRLHNTDKVDWAEVHKHLPMNTKDEAVGLEPWGIWRAWMAHPCDGDFWRGPFDAKSEIGKVTAAAFITGGWFDAFLKDTLDAFSSIRKNGASKEAREFTRCVMEPLDHDMRTFDVDYGEGHLAGIIKTRGTFMENILKNPHEDPLPGHPAMRYFLMGSNEWRETDEWPLKETVYTPFYLHSAGAANTVYGDGVIDANEPDGIEQDDIFLYNPEDPVPTWGGNHLGFTKAGQRRQNEIEKRSDVLVFTSEKLTEDMDVIGNVRAMIYAATDGRDTDFTVRLCDVAEDGTSYNICDGILRGRFRNGQEKEELLEPGKVYEYDIDCWATAWTFKAGHRIRVQVSSSNFPAFDRNLNTGLDLTASSEIRIAKQTVCHKAGCASRIILPVIPKKG